MPARVRPQAPSQRQDVPVGFAALYARAPDPYRDRQGQEPLAQRGRPLRRVAAVLRHEGDELLHSSLRCQQSSW